MVNVVFIHGLWIAHTAWQPWIDYFSSNGHPSVAPAWPGEADTVEDTRARPAAQAGFGVNALTDHFARIVGQFETPPVAIGHSFGGLIAQKLLGENKVPQPWPSTPPRSRASNHCPSRNCVRRFRYWATHSITDVRRH